MVSLGRTVTDGNPVPIVSTEIERAVDDMLIAYSTLPGLPIIYQVKTRKRELMVLFIQDLFLIAKRARELGLLRPSA